jgi:hypothetical protein
MGSNIFLQYLSWHFWDVPKEILRGWGNFLRFNLNYFSIGLLLKTFFAPWKKYTWFYPRGFDPKKYLEVFISNMISRLIGAGVRFWLILFGVLTEILIIFLGIIIFFLWLLLPFLLIAGFLLGLLILF